jgi:hypothetical protein
MDMECEDSFATIAPAPEEELMSLESRRGSYSPTRKSEIPVEPWEAFLLKCSTSKSELLANKALGDAVKKAVQDFLASKGLVLPTTLDGGWDVSKLSRDNYKALTKIVVALVLKLRK